MLMIVTLSRRVLLAVLIILVVVGLFAGYNALPAPASSASPTPMPTIALPTTPRALMTLPAVDSNGVGRLAELLVEMRPGTGKVFIAFNENNPILNDETQASLKTAIAVARRYATINDADYDLHYTMSAPSATVGGSSAGAAMAVATLLLLQGKTPRNDTVITGTITEEGFIGQVGGVLEKARAAKEAGFTRMVVPRGEAEEIVPRQVCTETKSGSSSVKSCQTRDVLVRVDDEIGITILEARDVLQAVEFFSGGVQ